MTSTNLRDEFSKRMTLKDAAAAADEQHSHDSQSTDEEVGSPKGMIVKKLSDLNRLLL